MKSSPSPLQTCALGIRRGPSPLRIPRSKSWEGLGILLQKGSQESLDLSSVAVEPMIKAVFLDFYGTLVRFHPPAEVIQTEACAAEGLTMLAEELARAYPVADAYMAQENARSLVWGRAEPERKAFFAEYERRLLEAAGRPVTLEVAARVWHRVQATPRDLALYEDSLPAVEEIHGAGLITGIISNMERDMASLVDRVGLGGHVDHMVGSYEVGVGKPHAPIFEAALAKAGVPPEQAIHVGDQYDSDVVGAQGAGMHALLLDREGSATPPPGTPVVTTLRQVLSYVRSELHLAPS